MMILLKWKLWIKKEIDNNSWLWRYETSFRIKISSSAPKVLVYTFFFKKTIPEKNRVVDVNNELERDSFQPFFFLIKSENDLARRQGNLDISL